MKAEAVAPPDLEDESGPGAFSDMRWQGRPLHGEDGGASDRAQRDFADPESQILNMGDGFVQGYNGQITFDVAHYIILAYRLVTNSADPRALAQLFDDVRAHLRRMPCKVLDNAGFDNKANLAAPTERRLTA